MIRKLAIAAVAGAVFSGAGFVAAAEAAEPAVQGCMGDFWNGTMPEDGGPRQPPVGSIVSPLAQDPPEGTATFGDALQFLAAGLVPDELFENSCNDLG